LYLFIAADDFTLNDITLNFTSTSPNRQCFSFMAVNDTFVESDEVVILQASTSNALDNFMGDDEFNVTIMDEDGMCVCVV